MRRISSNSESGAILAIVIILMLALTITGIAFLNAGVMEYRLAKREDYKNKAFYIAEGGLERTLWNLKQDFVNSTSTPDWTDGDINEVSVVDLPGDDPDYVPPGDPDYPDRWRLLDYDEASLSLGDGVYLVKVKYVDKDEIWVKSTGTVESIPRTVQVYVKAENVFPWNNAIFAAAGAVGGAVIEGSARIHGSVHILGEEIGDAVVMDTSGDAGMRNYYKEGMGGGMPLNLAETELGRRIPDCPTRTFNGETVQSLDAVLRVRRGDVDLSGNASIGEPDFPGDFFKETVDAVYTDGGFGGTGGEANVHSDNGIEEYEPGVSLQFPKLDEPYVDPDTKIEYDTYWDYLNANALPIALSQISSEVLEYTSSDATNSIDWNWHQDTGKGVLEVEGIVWVQANELVLGKKGETIEYRGKGIIVVGEQDMGDIRVHGHLLAQGEYYFEGGGFPNHVLGLVAGHNIYLAPDDADSQLNMTGAFYAAHEIHSRKQNEIAGTFVCNRFNISGQVPRIYQVPELANNLPPGMPGGTPNWYITTGQWSES